MTRLAATRETFPSSFWDNSKHLDEYLHGDHRYTETVRERIYKRSYAKHLQRPVPLVKSLSMELTPHYASAPVRVLTGDGAQEISAAYRSMSMNRRIAEIAAGAVVQGTKVVPWLPTRTGAREWTIHALSPWECEVYPDASAPGELSRARLIRMRLPRVCSDSYTDYDIAELALAGADLTETHASGETRRRVAAGLSAAVWASDGAGVYDETGDLPLGMYPVALWRIGKPKTGEFWGPQSEYLLQAQVAMDLSMSGIEIGARYSSGQLWGTSDKPQPEDMPFGSDTCLWLSEDETLNHTPRPFDAASYAESIRIYVAAFRLAVGLRPESYSGAAVTADAKLLELWTQGTLRADIQSALVEGENSMARAAAIALGWRMGGGSAPLDVSNVRMIYQLPEPPRNPMQMAQAAEMRARLGVEPAWSVVQREQRAHGNELTQAAAQAYVDAAREDWEAANMQVQGPNASGT